MIRPIIDLFSFFFLHIQINTLNLPYIEKLPRSRGANFFSKKLRSFFEKHWIKKLVGVNLVTAMVAIPFFSQSQPIAYTHPSPIEQSELITEPDFYTPIHTTPRKVVVPVDNLRYIGQGYHSGHRALDLNSYIGSPVRAFSDARVFKIEDTAFGYGRYIILDHGHGLTSVYAHMDKLTVSLGQILKAGDQIGTIGMTGHTTGPHLHFEIRDNGVALDPYTYLNL